jgi:protein-S-isoprenylcysteine O-methyltransferase Ste14
MPGGCWHHLRGRSSIGAPVTFVATAIVRVLMLRRRIRVEEAMMLERFGAEYEEYAQGTSRLIPGVY